MDERQVKAAALMLLRKTCGRRRKPVITAEFLLGNSGVRADLVVFDRETTGFEIKTARDTLRRLQSQMAAYSRYFDRTVLIVAPCHLPKLIDHHLCGASVWTYDEKGVFSIVRNGVANAVDEAALDDVLTQAERGKYKFEEAMIARYAATSRHFWRAVSRRSIQPDDLPLLSRFADNRAQARRLAEERDARWSLWLAAQEHF